MEVIHFSETSVHIRNTRRYIPGRLEHSLKCHVQRIRNKLRATIQRYRKLNSNGNLTVPEHDKGKVRTVKIDCVHQNLIKNSITYIKLLIPIRYHWIVKYSIQMSNPSKKHITPCNRQRCWTKSYRLLITWILLSLAEGRKISVATSRACGGAELYVSAHICLNTSILFKKKSANIVNHQKRAAGRRQIRIHL
jgi:hypothetical protein